MLLDTFLARGVSPSCIHIVSNIPAADNDTLDAAYLPFGVTVHEHRHSDLEAAFFAGKELHIAATFAATRRKIAAFFLQHFAVGSDRYAAAIHPTAYLAQGVSHGPGVQVGPATVIAPFTALGEHVFVNRSVSLGHHNTIGDYVNINPGVIMSGRCDIGPGVTIGSGAVIVDRIRIGAGSVIGAGAVVTRDIPEGVVAYGNPAKVIRETDRTLN